MSNPAFVKCVCGHIEYHHFDKELCYFSSGMQRPMEVLCECKGFKPDNLKMLEDMLSDN